MGKKRFRVPGEPRASAKNASKENSIQHSQTLEEDVREHRDVQFAAEKKQTERSKRRRMEDEQAFEAKTSKTRIGNRRIDARNAGLQMWRNAALRRKARKQNSENNDDDEKNGVDDMGVDDKTGAKIIDEARKQRAEIRAERAVNEGDSADDSDKFSTGAMLQSLEVEGLDENDSDDEEDSDARSIANTDGDWQSTIGDTKRDLDFLDGSRVTEADELALSLFAGAHGGDSGTTNDDGEQNGSSGPKIMLADIILQKIQEKEEADARAAAIAADPAKAERDRKIAEVYGLVGNIMAKYRSGKVPKAFKLIPNVRNWQDLLYLTRPDEWSPAAVYVATRLMVSNLPAKQVVSYYTEILLPRCLQDIAEHKKLNYHLYRALMKAVYKPDSFCKGILFPLCEDDSCTLRQATIVSSVVSRVSIPMLHSAASLLYITQLRFTPTTCLLVNALLGKKYALPYRVVDGVVKWFVKMKSDDRPLPVLWHKSLLVFAQHYKMEITMEQKEQLKLLMRHHTHALITPEIRRELFSARNRGDLMDPDANTIAQNIAEAAMTD